MITDSQFESMTATQMAAAVRDRDVSPVELVDACIERIEQRNPSLDGLDPWDGDIFWAKVGLLVRSATPVRIALSQDVRKTAMVTWGSPTPSLEQPSPGAQVELPACQLDGGWVAWPGGFFVNEPFV